MAKDSFTLYFTDTAWHRMMALVQEAPGEVSGWGRISIDDEGDIVCDRIAMLNQWNSGASTHIDMKALARFAVDLATKHGIEERNRWRLWFHSHPGGGRPAYSAVDFASLKGRVQEVGVPFFVGVVVGSDGKNGTAYLSMRQPFNALIEGDISKLSSSQEVAIQELIDGMRKETEKAAKAQLAWAKETLKQHTIEDPTRPKVEPRKSGSDGGFNLPPRRAEGSFVRSRRRGKCTCGARLVSGRITGYLFCNDCFRDPSKCTCSKQQATPDKLCSTCKYRSLYVVYAGANKYEHCAGCGLEEADCECLSVGTRTIPGLLPSGASQTKEGG